MRSSNGFVSTPIDTRVSAVIRMLINGTRGKCHDSIYSKCIREIVSLSPRSLNAPAPSHTVSEKFYGVFIVL